MAPPLNYICGIAAGYIAPAARLYPPFRRVMFFALWAKSKCVRAVRAHLYKGVTQRWIPALGHICGTPPLKCAAMGGTPKYFAPKMGQNISHARSAYFTAAQRRFHAAACRRISLRCTRKARAKHGHNRAVGAIYLFGVPPKNITEMRRTNAAIRPALLYSKEKQQ